MPNRSSLKEYSRCIPVRVVVLISVALLQCLMELERWLFYSAIGEMTYSHEHDEEDDVGDHECPHMLVESWPFSTRKKQGIYLYWDITMRIALNQVFSLGNLFTQIPGGIISDFYGSRGMAIIALVLFGVFYLTQPLMADLGQNQFMLIRFIIGMIQGFLLSSYYSILAHWAPMGERNKFVAFSSLGTFGGVFFAYLMIILTPSKWQIKLYTPGICSLLLAIFWYFLVYSEPAKCPYISDDERSLITKNIKGLTGQEPLQYPYVPWKSMISSPPYLALVLYYVGFYWAVDTIWKQHYFYLLKVINLTENLVYYSVFMSYLGETISALLWGATSDWLIRNGYISQTNNRKWFGFAAAMLLIPQLFATLVPHCNGLVVSAIYICVFFTKGLALGSIMANAIDLSPRFAGVNYSVIISANSVVIIISSIVMKAFCQKGGIGDPDCWWNEDLIMAGVVLVFTLPYLWFGSADVQSWNYSGASSGRRPNIDDINSTVN